jgi:hypothetical protein
MAVSSNFNPATGVLTTTGDNHDNTITASRDTAGNMQNTANQEAHKKLRRTGSQPLSRRGWHETGGKLELPANIMVLFAERVHEGN